MRRSSRLQVNSAIDLRAMVALARGASAWWSRPALLGREATVISASDELWQAAVQALSHHTNVVIVDASDRSAHVEWELNLLRAEHVPHVMIVERGSPRDSEQGVGPTFAYDLRDAPGLKRFRSTVAAELMRLARPTAEMAHDWKSTLHEVARLACTYGLILALAAAAGIAVGLLSAQLYLPLLYRTS